MRVGLILPNRGPIMGATSVPDLLGLAESAERAGWNSVWVGDSVLAKPRIDSIAMLSAIAARTQSIRLGVACMASTPLRDPLLLAYQWASLDAIASGRTVFVACQGGGPGSGEFETELAAFGISRESRSARMAEAIEIMRLAWSGASFRYRGRYRMIPELRLQPTPTTPIPIWIAANPDFSKPRNVDSAFRRVAKYGDGWQTTHTTPDNVRTSLDIIHSYALQMGRVLPPDFEVSVCSNICVDGDPNWAWEEATRFLNAHSQTDYSQDFLRNWVACGTASQCVTYLERFREAGATSILLRISSFSQLDQFTRITRDVLPALAA